MHQSFAPGALRAWNFAGRASPRSPLPRVIHYAVCARCWRIDDRTPVLPFFSVQYSCESKPHKNTAPHPCLEALVYPFQSLGLWCAYSTLAHANGSAFSIVFSILSFDFMRLLPEPGEVASFTVFDSRLSPIDETQKKFPSRFGLWLKLYLPNVNTYLPQG